MVFIRDCTDADLIQVVRLSNQWSRENVTIGYENVSWTEDKIRTRLNDYFVIAEIDKKIIGYCFGDVREGNAQPVIKHDEKYLEIFEVYVDIEYRSQGIGRMLVERLISKSEENDITRILVGSSNRRWEETIRFYKDQGFQMWYFQMYK